MAENPGINIVGREEFDATRGTAAKILKMLKRDKVNPNRGANALVMALATAIVNMSGGDHALSVELTNMTAELLKAQVLNFTPKRGQS